MEEKRKKIEEILIWIGKMSDFDIMAMAEQIRNGKYSFSGSLSKYELSSCLRDAVTVYLEGEFDASFVKLRKFLYLLIESYSYEKSPKGLKEYADLLIGASERIEICDYYIEEWKNETDKEMRMAFPLYSETVSFNAYDCLSIKKSIDGRYFHLYKYRNGIEFNKTDKYKLYDGIIASDNISNLLNNTGLEDTWGITIGLYLEEKIDLSYFVITFSLNGNIWVLTDRLVYENPDQINRLRGGGRRFSEDRERNLDFLPYILIDKVIEKRNDTKEITKSNGSEVWVFPMKDFFCENLYYIIKYTIQKIQSDYVVKNLIGIGKETLLLTDGCVDMSDDSHFSKTNIQTLNEIVDEIYGESSKALVLQNKNLVEQLGVSTELMTIEEVQTHTQYLAHKKVVEEHEKEKWGSFDKTKSYYDTYKEYDRQRKLLMEMFRNKSNEVERFLFAGENVFVHDVNHPNIYSAGFGNSKYGRFTQKFVSNRTVFGGVLGSTCLCGDGREVKKQEYFKTFEFLRYTEITAILGITRKELPPLFRDYIAHYCLPYIGNPILDNVKPEFFALECDYASKKEPNGFFVSFPYCGFCHKKLYKKYKVAEEAVIVISSKQNAVIEILPKDEFMKKYN